MEHRWPQRAPTCRTPNTSQLEAAVEDAEKALKRKRDEDVRRNIRDIYRYIVKIYEQAKINANLLLLLSFASANTRRGKETYSFVLSAH